jgi:alginate O-acetyltransferase complex protein AlgJ
MPMRTENLQRVARWGCLFLVAVFAFSIVMLVRSNLKLHERYRSLSTFLDAGTFSEENDARLLQEMLVSKGYECYIEKAQNDTFRVLLFFDTDKIVGKDGWLYDDWNKSIEYYRGISPFPHDDLMLWRRTMEKRATLLAKQSTKYLVVVCPIKLSIYPEYLPDGIRPLSRVSRLDQLVEELRDVQNLQILDLRKPLSLKKSTGLLYDRLGCHWNALGAFWGYQGIIEAISAWHPFVQPMAMESFKFENVHGGGDMAYLIGTELENILSQETVVSTRSFDFPRVPLDGYWRKKYKALYEVFAIEKPDPDLPTAVLFYDSFGGAVIPFLAEHFKRLVCISQTQDYVMYFDPEIVEKERPDVVIQLFVERRLMDRKLWGFDLGGH